MEITQADVVLALGNLSVLELISLTKHLEKEWDVKAEPPKIQLRSEELEAPKTSLQAEFNVILVGYPADKKMTLIKAVREVMALGLKEAKDFVESAPKILKEAISAEEADAIKIKLTEAGGIIEVK